MNKINLQAALSSFDELWSPRVIGELNEQHVKVTKVQGTFDWHHHAEEDELFLVLKGELEIEMRDRSVHLAEGDLFIVPRGVEHRPVAEREAHLLLFEPATTLNTGNLRNDRTIDHLARLTDESH